MARTRRRASYRRSRRWNPDAAPAAVAAPAKTNPRRRISRRTRRHYPAASASECRAWRGRRAHANPGSWHMDREVRSARHAKRHRSSARKHFKGYSRRKAAHVVDYALGRFNPKRGRKSRGHKARGHRGHKRGKRTSYRRYKSRNARHTKHYRSKGRSKARHGRGRARSNPAQFPMPFFSAMTNPGRRSRTRRNHPIKRKDARAMKRVLRSHHYSCR